MSSQRNQDGNGEHFDEVDAVRRFPSEDTWLDLPMPDLHDTAAQDTAAQDGERPSADNRSFIDRVMQARQADLQLDEQLAAMEQLLPSELLAEYAAPTPSSNFVSTTVEKVMQDRRQRWQEMLSRHVAPEPSTEFVARTLAALQEASQSQQGQPQRSQPQRSQPQSSQERQGSGITAASPTVATNLRLQAPPAPNRSQHWSVFSLVAAAAAAMIWLMVSREQRAPLELRLALQASPAIAYSDSTTPMSAILAHIAADEEPLATFDAPADGLWLIGTQGGLR